MLGFFRQPSDIAEVSEIVYFRPSFPISHLFRRIRRKLVCHAFCRSTIFRRNLRDISNIWENTWFLEHQKKKVTWLIQKTSKLLFTNVHKRVL